MCTAAELQAGRTGSKEASVAEHALHRTGGPKDRAWPAQPAPDQVGRACGMAAAAVSRHR